MWFICYSWRATIYRLLLTEVHSLPGHSLCVGHSMGFDECIMSCIHHYNFIQNSFTVLKISCSYLLILPPTPTFPVTTDLFTVSIVLPFPECQIAGIIRYAVFQIGFFHLAMCLLMAWQPSSFYHWIIFLYVGIQQLSFLYNKCEITIRFFKANVKLLFLPMFTFYFRFLKSLMRCHWMKQFDMVTLIASSRQGLVEKKTLNNLKHILLLRMMFKHNLL